MKISVSVEGEETEAVGLELERIGRAIRKGYGTDAVEMATKEGSSALKEDVFRKVWGRITPKAREAMLALQANPAGLTKEEIVGAVPLLADTRDLGGALSSIARVCKALKVTNNQEAVYRKHEGTVGRVLYKLTDDARVYVTDLKSEKAND